MHIGSAPICLARGGESLQYLRRLLLGAPAPTLNGVPGCVPQAYGFMTYALLTLPQLR